MRIINLFIAFLRVGIFSIGGGYTLIPLIEREVVDNFSWLTKEEFLQVMGAGQGLPGAISVKFATYTGYKVAGISGVIAANMGIILPPVLGMLLFLLIFNKSESSSRVRFFLKGIAYGTLGLVVTVIFDMARSLSWGVLGFLIFLLSFTGAYFKIHPGIVILCAGIIGALSFK